MSVVSKYVSSLGVFCIVGQFPKLRRLVKYVDQESSASVLVRMWFLEGSVRLQFRL